MSTGTLIYSWRVRGHVGFEIGVFSIFVARSVFKVQSPTWAQKRALSALIMGRGVRARLKAPLGSKRAIPQNRAGRNWLGTRSVFKPLYLSQIQRYSLVIDGKRKRRRFRTEKVFQLDCTASWSRVKLVLIEPKAAKNQSCRIQKLDTCLD